VREEGKEGREVRMGTEREGLSLVVCAGDGVLCCGAVWCAVGD
jgi:hypothetical protein